MPASPTVLHYVGANDDRGGIVSVVRALASEGRFECVLGVSEGCFQRRSPPLPLVEFPRVEAETIGLINLWRARAVAHRVQAWLRADPRRIFHGHSRAGMLVGLWLNRWKERRLVVSVHCYGRQRWFYRAAARQLGGRLYFLSPAMRRYYGIDGSDSAGCVPGCVPVEPAEEGARVRGGTVRLGGVGALVRWKGWHQVLAAWALLPAEVRTRLRFTHIGADDGSADSRAYAEELRSATTALDAATSIRWLGQQSSSKEFLAETDVLLVASENEPLSVAMLEALLSGVPVLAADSGGSVDVITSGVNGWLFRTGSTADLARALRVLVETDVLDGIRIDRGSLARFTAPVVAAQWAEIYRSCR